MSFLSNIFGSKPNYSNVKSPYQQTAALVPGLPNMTSTAAGNIQTELSGALPTDVQETIRNAGATWGVNSGMPGSGASGNATLQSLGLNSLAEKQQGQTDYLNFLTGVGSQQMPVQEQMTAANAAAAPSPWMAGINNEVLGLVGAYLGGGGAGFGGANTGTSYQSTGAGQYQSTGAGQTVQGTGFSDYNSYQMPESDELMMDEALGNIGAGAGG